MRKRFTARHPLLGRATTEIADKAGRALGASCMPATSDPFPTPKRNMLLCPSSSPHSAAIPSAISNSSTRGGNDAGSEWKDRYTRVLRPQRSFPRTGRHCKRNLRALQMRKIAMQLQTCTQRKILSGSDHPERRLPGTIGGISPTPHLNSAALAEPGPGTGQYQCAGTACVPWSCFTNATEATGDTSPPGDIGVS